MKKLNNFELCVFHSIVEEVQKDHPEWRIGQTYFNVLNELYPELANQIRATIYDPFYVCNEKKLYTFLKFITENEN